MELPSVGRQEFLGALGRLAGGVTLVTSRGQQKDCGMTATSFISVSVEPPLVLVALDRTSETAASVTNSGSFGVSLLTAEQSELSKRFAVPGQGDKFATGRWRVGLTGVPVLEDAHATLECVVYSQHPAGDHVLYLGRVIGTCLADDSLPLIYHQMAYHFPQSLE